MKVAILSTGDELMQGVITNTNEQWLSEKVRTLRFEVVARACVADNLQEIGDALKWLATKADLVLVSGGLGPTADDLTLEAAAKAFNSKLVFHEEVMQKIRERFAKVGREMSASNERQAWLPENSIPLANYQGTAPGVHWQVEEKDIFFFPGVPKELYFIFENSVQPWLQAKSQTHISEKVLRCFGLPEATIDTKLQGLHLHGASLSFRVKFPEVLLKVWLAGDAEKTQPILQNIIAEMKTRLGEAAYAEGEENLAQLVAKQLTEHQQTLDVAESCTGGYLSHLLTGVPGASHWFLQGIVSYHNFSKEELLHVSHELIKKHGAVSQEVALAMAEGIRERTHSDWGIGITGIAGPSGGTAEKPVGTVFIALAGCQQNIVREFHFPRERKEFKMLTSWTALSLLSRQFQLAK